MTKFYMIPFLCLGIAFAAQAQRQNVYFLNKNNIQVQVRDSADYLRIVEEPEAGSSLYPVKEYYIDGSKKSLGYSTKIQPPSYEGQRVEYFKNGKRKRLSTYAAGKLTGSVFDYFPNGKLYRLSTYATNKKEAVPAVLVKEVNDSTGNALVADGQGTAIFYDEEFSKVVDSGAIQNGLHEGIWKGTVLNAGLRFKET